MLTLPNMGAHFEWASSPLNLWLPFNPAWESQLLRMGAGGGSCRESLLPENGGRQELCPLPCLWYFLAYWTLFHLQAKARKIETGSPKGFFSVFAPEKFVIAISSTLKHPQNWVICGIYLQALPLENIQKNSNALQIRNYCFASLFYFWIFSFKMRSVTFL